MGQRTRMGRAKTGGKPISRAEYRKAATCRQAAGYARSREAGTFRLTNAEGRMRFMATHAGHPWVKYERTEQSSYSGPRTAPPAVATTRVLPAYRKTGVETRPDGKRRFVWQLISFLLGK